MLPRAFYCTMLNVKIAAITVLMTGIKQAADEDDEDGGGGNDDDGDVVILAMIEYKDLGI